MATVYSAKGVCAEKIQFNVEDDGSVHKVMFMGGCSGNAKGLAKVLEGQNINDVITELKGVDCRGKGTSCPDQLAIALEQYLEEHPELKRN